MWHPGSELGYLLAAIGILGFVLNFRSILLMLMCIELLLLGITLIILYTGSALDDSMGSYFALTIITIAGGESALGLGILINYFGLRGTIAEEV